MAVNSWSTKEGGGEQKLLCSPRVIAKEIELFRFQLFICEISQSVYFFIESVGTVLLQVAAMAGNIKSNDSSFFMDG